MGSATALTGGINYMLTDNWAVDVPFGLPFKHKFYGDGAIAGVGEVGETKVIPATVFAQYRFGEANAKFRPYLGLGVTYAKFFKERTTATMTGLTGGSPANPTTASIDSRWGLTPQVGFVWNFNERWFVDAAYYKSFLKTTSHLSTGQSIDIRLNPTCSRWASATGSDASAPQRKSRPARVGFLHGGAAPVGARRPLRHQRARRRS